MKSLQIKRLEEKHIKDVVHIHQDALGYTFNSHLGSDHLAFMYRIMAQHEESYVGVALFDDKLVGVISGTLDMNRVKKMLLNSLNSKRWVNLISHIFRQPSLVNEYWKGNIVSKTVSFNNGIIRPTLTTIAVDSNFHGKGIGRCLLQELEHFFKEKGVQYYRLDTLITNSGAREFYRKLGFRQIETRSNSVVYIKDIYSD